MLFSFGIFFLCDLVFLVNCAVISFFSFSPFFLSASTLSSTSLVVRYLINSIIFFCSFFLLVGSFSKAASRALNLLSSSSFSSLAVRSSFICFSSSSIFSLSAFSSSSRSSRTFSSASKVLNSSPSSMF